VLLVEMTAVQNFPGAVADLLSLTFLIRTCFLMIKINIFDPGFDYAEVISSLEKHYDSSD